MVSSRPLLVGLLLCGLIAVAVGVGVAKVADRQSLLVLAVGVVLAGALAFLAATRFALFLLVLLVFRASLDALKPGGLGGNSVTSPGVLVGGVLLLASLLWLFAEGGGQVGPPLSHGDVAVRRCVCGPAEHCRVASSE